MITVVTGLSIIFLLQKDRTVHDGDDNGSRIGFPLQAAVTDSIQQLSKRGEQIYAFTIIMRHGSALRYVNNVPDIPQAPINAMALYRSERRTVSPYVAPRPVAWAPDSRTWLVPTCDPNYDKGTAAARPRSALLGNDNNDGNTDDTTTRDPDGRVLTTKTYRGPGGTSRLQQTERTPVQRHLGEKPLSARLL